MAEVVASILHGAHGDYYQQSMCLKHMKKQNPDLRLKLFFAMQHRYEVFKVLDYSFAEHVGMWTDLAEQSFDRFHQFQVLDPELQEDVLDRLPPEVLERLDRRTNHLPWRYLPRLFPPGPDDMLSLNQPGREMLAREMAAKGIDQETFARPTIGVVWRFRGAGGAVHPFLQPPAEVMRRKYSRALGRLIREFDCNVLICGMNLEMDDQARIILDNKFPPYGLDLPAERTIYVNGLNFIINAEILSRCDVCLVHSSGFSEYVYMRKGGDMFLVDTPASYLLKMIKYRLPFFDYFAPRTFVRQWLRPHSEDRIHRWLARALRAKLRAGAGG